MKKLNFKVQGLIAKILIERSVPNGVALFIRDELRNRRKSIIAK